MKNVQHTKAGIFVLVIRILNFGFGLFVESRSVLRPVRNITNLHVQNIVSA